QPLARSELKHVRSSRSERSSRAQGGAAADGDRKRLSLSRRMVWSHGIPNRHVRLARRLSWTDNRLDRGDRIELYGRCPRARHSSSSAKVARTWPARPSADIVGSPIERLRNIARKLLAGWRSLGDT